MSTEFNEGHQEFKLFLCKTGLVYTEDLLHPLGLTNRQLNEQLRSRGATPIAFGSNQKVHSNLWAVESLLQLSDEEIENAISSVGPEDLEPQKPSGGTKKKLTAKRSNSKKS